MPLSQALRPALWHSRPAFRDEFLIDIPAVPRKTARMTFEIDGSVDLTAQRLRIALGSITNFLIFHLVSFVDFLFPAESVFELKTNN